LTHWNDRVGQVEPEKESTTMTATLEHANLTVSDPLATATWMEAVFGWHIRWQGPAKDNGFTVHVGESETYLALYRPRTAPDVAAKRSYDTVGGLNHVGVTVEDLDETERRVLAEGFATHSHADYEPGRRFYFHDRDGIEFEIVSYR
jgi:catechol 2,3-dioxygenase-like lactoylglutathione lyase family enzyme